MGAHPPARGFHGRRHFRLIAVRVRGRERCNSPYPMASMHPALLMSDGDPTAICCATLPALHIGYHALVPMALSTGIPLA